MKRISLLALALVILSLSFISTASATVYTTAKLNNWLGVAARTWASIGQTCDFRPSWRWGDAEGYDGYVNDIGGCKVDEYEDHSAATSVIEFNSQTFREGNKATACSLVVHEYGHLLGFNHSENPRNIMYPLQTGKNIVAGCKSVRKRR